MKEERLLPLIPIRGLTVFPYMTASFDLGREKSIRAMEAALENDDYVILSMQKEDEIEEPTKKDINKIGILCQVKNVLPLPGRHMRVVVEGIARVGVKAKDEEPYFTSSITLKEDKGIRGTKKLTDLAIRLFKEYSKLAGNDADRVIGNETSGEVITYKIIPFLNLPLEEKQQYLEELNVKNRLETLIKLLKEEIEMLTLELEIGLKTRGKIDKSQRDYLIKEQIKVLNEELGDDEDSEIEIYKDRIKKAKLPREVKKKAIYEVKRLEKSGTYSSEGAIVKTYLDWILDLPFDRKSEDNLDIENSKKVLELDHYGMDKVKERIIEHLSVNSYRKKQGSIICLLGPPGVGKTSIARSIASAMNRKFTRISLGGISDEADIRGHRKTYVGAIPGRFIYALKEAKTKNPLILLDEIDKISNNYKGNPYDALLEVLDSEQNVKFRDHYLEVDFDLSDVMFIATANSLNGIPSPLLDRMEIIEVSSYTREEKFHIAKKYLVEKQLEKHSLKSKFKKKEESLVLNEVAAETDIEEVASIIEAVIDEEISDEEAIEKLGLSDYLQDEIIRSAMEGTMDIDVSEIGSFNDIQQVANEILKEKEELNKEDEIKQKVVTFSDNVIYYIIDHYTREAGVRSLERTIESVIRKAIKEMIEDNRDKINITKKIISKYLGKEKYDFDKIAKKDHVGVVTGLAYTSYGGATLPIEVVVMEGSGRINLTGRLGDVMKESAGIAYSYVRAHRKELGIKEEFHKNKDIHIHAPEGAVPKDGPSAGVTLVTAIVSALTGRKVKRDIAMTGEVTLTGRVLSIGGLKEKSISAERFGINTIIIPKDNIKDLEDVPKSVLDNVKIISATDVKDVIKNALIK